MTWLAEFVDLLVLDNFLKIVKDLLYRDEGIC